MKVRRVDIKFVAVKHDDGTAVAASTALDGALKRRLAVPTAGCREHKWGAKFVTAGALFLGPFAIYLTAGAGRAGSVVSPSHHHGA